MSSLSSNSNKFFEEPKDMDWITELKSKSDTNDINGFVECTKNFIDYAITYLCDKSFNDQIIISRYYFQILKDFLKKEWSHIFLKSIVQFVFDVIIEENSKYWCIKKELLKIFVCLARELENRKQVVKELPEIYLLKIMDNITSCGDYDMQVILIDTIFLLYESQYINTKLKDLIPESEEISKKFANISTDTFQKDCRLFLNILNKQHNNIYSSTCKSIQIEHTKSFALLKYDGFWIDFNTYNKAISWYQLAVSKEREELDVELITLFATEIKKITVKRCDEDLIIHFNLKGCLLTSLKGNESDYNQSKNVTMVFDINDSTEKLHEVLLQIFDEETYEANLNKNLHLVKKVSKKSTNKGSATQSYLAPYINDSYFFSDDCSLTLSNKSEDLNHNKNNVNSLNIGTKKCSEAIINAESKCLINNSIYKKSQTGLAQNVRKCSTSTKLPANKEHNEQAKKFKKVSECLINNPFYKKSQTGFAQNVRKCLTSTNLPTNKQDSLKSRSSSCSEKENINKRENIYNSGTMETFKTASEFASLIVNTGKKISQSGNQNLEQSEDENSEDRSDFIEKLICTNKIISTQDSNKGTIEQKYNNEIDKKVNKEQISNLNDAFAIIENNSKASSLNLTAIKSKEIYNSFEIKDENALYMLDTINLTEEQTLEKSIEEEADLEKENGTTFKAKNMVVKQEASKIGGDEPPESLEGEDKTNKSKVTEDSLHNQHRKKLPDDEADLEIRRDVNRSSFTDEEKENESGHESNLSKVNEDFSKTTSFDKTAIKSGESYDSFELKEKNSPYLLDTIDLTEEHIQKKSKEEKTIDFPEKENGTTFKAKIGQDNYISNKNKKDKYHELNKTDLEEEPPESLKGGDKTNKSKVIEDTLQSQKRKSKPDDEAGLKIRRDVNSSNFDEEKENESGHESNLSKVNEDFSKTTSFDVISIKSEESYDSFELKEKNSPYLLDTIDLTEESIQEKSKEEKISSFPENENGTTFKAKARVIEQEADKIGQNNYISNKNKKDKCHELNKTDLIEEECAESLEEEDKTNKSKVIEDTLQSQKRKSKPDDEAGLEIRRDVNSSNFTDEEKENESGHESNLSKVNEDFSETTSFDVTSIKSGESYDSFELKEKNSPYLLNTIDLTEEHIQEKSKKEKINSFPEKENGTTFKAKARVIKQKATKIGQDNYIYNKNKKDECHDLNKTDLIEEECAESLEEEDKTNKSKVIEDTLQSQKRKSKPDDEAGLEIRRDVNSSNFTDEEKENESGHESNLSKVNEDFSETTSFDVSSIKSGESYDSFELKEKNSPYLLNTIDLTEEHIQEKSKKEKINSFPEKENGTTFKAKARVIKHKATEIGQDNYIYNKNKKHECHELNKTYLIEEESSEILKGEDKTNKSKVIEDTPSKKIRHKPDDKADLGIRRDVNIWHFTDEEQGSEIEHELNLSKVIEDKTNTNSIDLTAIKSGESYDSFELKEKNSPYLLDTIDLTEEHMQVKSKEKPIDFPENENGTTFKAKARDIEQEATKIGQDNYIYNKNKKVECHELNKTDLIEEESSKSLKGEDKTNKSKVIEDTLQSQKRKSKPDVKAGLEIRRDVNKSNFTNEEKENKSGHESNLSKVNEDISKTTSFDKTAIKSGESYDSFELKEKNSSYLLDTIDLTEESIQEKSKEEKITSFPENENGTTIKAKARVIEQEADKIGQNNYISNKNKKDKCHELNKTDLIEEECAESLEGEDKTNKSKVIEDTLLSKKIKHKLDDKADLEIRRDVNIRHFTDEEQGSEIEHELNLYKGIEDKTKTKSIDLTAIKSGENYDRFELKEKNSPYLLDTIDLTEEHMQVKSKEKTIDFPEKENGTTFKAKTMDIVLEVTEINQNNLISNKKEIDECHGLNISDLTEGESSINIKSGRTNKSKYNTLNRKRKTKLLISSDEQTDFVKSKKPKFEKKRKPVIYKKNKSSKTEFKRKKGSSVFLKTRQSKKTIDNFKRITKKLDLEDFKIEEKDLINDKRTDKLDIELTEEESLQGENTYNSNIIEVTSDCRKRKAKPGIFSDEEEEVGKKKSSKKTIIECISKREYKTNKINEKCKTKILDLKDSEAKQKNVTNEISKESDKLKELKTPELKSSYLSKISLKEVTPESIHKCSVGDALIKKQDDNNIFAQSLIDVDNIIDMNKTHMAENPFEVQSQENTPNSEIPDKVDNKLNINGKHISENPFEVLTQEYSPSNEVHTYEAIPEKQNDTTILEKVDKHLYINEKHISDNTFELLTKINSPIPKIPEDVHLTEKQDENIFTEAMDKVNNKIHNLNTKSSEFHEDEAEEQQDKNTFSQLLDEINDKMYTHNSDSLTFFDTDVNLEKNKNNFTTTNEPFEYFENLQEKCDVVSPNYKEDEIENNSLSKTFIDNITEQLHLSILENLSPLDNVNTNKPGSLNQSYNEIHVDLPMEIVSNDKVKVQKEQRINQKFNGLVSIRDQFEQCIGEVLLENTPKKDAVENQVLDKFDNASRSSITSKDKSTSTTLTKRKKLYDPNSIKDLIINTTVDTILPEPQKNEVLNLIPNDLNTKKKFFSSMEKYLPLGNLNDSSDSKPQKSYKSKPIKTKTEKILESFNLIKEPVKYNIPLLRSQGPQQLMKMKIESIYQKPKKQKRKPEKEKRRYSIKSIDQLLSLHKKTKNQNINIFNIKYKKRSNKVLSDNKLNRQTNKFGIQEPDKNVSLYEEENKSNKENNKIVILSDIKLNRQCNKLGIQEPEKNVSLYEDENIDSYFEEQSLINASIAKWTATAWFNHEMVTINSTDYLGKYVVLFFYPLDFIEEPYGAPPTEILSINEHYEDFLALKTEVFGCSVDSCFTHKAWLNSLQIPDSNLRFPLLSDLNHNISKMFKMSYLDTGHSCRGFYIMDPKGVIIAYSQTDITITLSIEDIILKIKHHQTKKAFY